MSEPWTGCHCRSSRSKRPSRCSTKDMFDCNDDWGAKSAAAHDYPSWKKRKSSSKVKRKGKRSKELECLVKGTVILGSGNPLKAPETNSGRNLEPVDSKKRKLGNSDGGSTSTEAPSDVPPKLKKSKKNKAHGDKTVSSPSNELTGVAVPNGRSAVRKEQRKGARQQPLEDVSMQPERREGQSSGEGAPDQTTERSKGREKIRPGAGSDQAKCAEPVASQSRKRAAGQEAPTRHEKDCKKATKGGSVLPKAALLRERLEAGSLLSSQVWPAAGAAARSQATSIGSGLLQKLTARLSGSRFRWLNETLYTSTGEGAFALLQSEPELFQQYHEGFQQQTKGWPQRPVDVAIAWLKSQPPDLRVADFGCGDIALALAVPQRVACLDLVATVPGVIACNMSHTPLESSSMDVAVFCLALMGTDYPAFLEEASRVLKPGGRLWIAEVRSRFVAGGREEFEPFVRALASLGYKLEERTTPNEMFAVLRFRKCRAAREGNAAPDWPKLKPCLYKRR